MELEAVGVGHIWDWFLGPAESHRNNLRPRLSLPDGYGLAIGTFVFRWRVIAPPYGHGDAVHFFRNKEAQAHRRGEKTLLRCFALFVRLLCETRQIRNHADVIVLVSVGALLGRCAHRD